VKRLIQPDDIYLANFPFGDMAGMKLRPILALTEEIGPVPEVLVAYISSVIPDRLLATDIVLDPKTTDHACTNLKTKSVLRLHKLATIHRAAIVRRLGQLPPPDVLQVNERLAELLHLQKK
jgi:mRNA interferase MazF